MVLMFAVTTATVADQQIQLPYIRIHQQKRFIEIDATLIRNQTLEDEWMELLACTVGGRDHESIVTVKARPRDIHFALLMLGLKPGKPMQWHIENNRVKIDNLPSGPRIAITAHYKIKDKSVHVPVNKWIDNRDTARPLKDNIWLFTGSRFVEYEGKRVYLADLNGSVISLVNFGDELLARPTDRTHLNDNATWTMSKTTLPKPGTKIILRLRPVPPKKHKRNRNNEGRLSRDAPPGPL